MIKFTYSELDSQSYTLSQQTLIDRDKVKSAIEPKIQEVNSFPRNSPSMLSMSGYCDEKEVVPMGHHRDLSAERIVLGSRDGFGLSVLFDGDGRSSTPYLSPSLSPPPPHAASLSSVSQVSLVSTERGTANEFSIIRGASDEDYFGRTS